MSLKGKTLFISGGSRGILAIALRAARDGANVTIAAGIGIPTRSCRAPSIRRRRRSRRRVAGLCLLSATSARKRIVAAAVAATGGKFGGIDICVNNASAIQLAGDAGN